MDSFLGTVTETVRPPELVGFEEVAGCGDAATLGTFEPGRDPSPQASSMVVKITASDISAAAGGDLRDPDELIANNSEPTWRLIYWFCDNSEE